MIVSIAGADGADAELATLNPLSVHVVSLIVDGRKSILLAKST